MRRSFFVAVLMSALIAFTYAGQPAATSAMQPVTTTASAGTTIADPRLDPNATVQDAVLLSQTTPPVAGPLQDTREVVPRKRQYLSSDVHLQDVVAQYSFVVPSLDGWMLGFTFWDDGQGNFYDLSLMDDGDHTIWGLGHTMSNNWQAEQLGDIVDDADILSMTPGSTDTLTLVVDNGVAILVAKNTQILAQVDISGTSSGDVGVKMGWNPGDTSAPPSVTMSISDFSVWDLSALQSMAPAVDPLPVPGIAPLLPPLQGTSALGMVFDHARTQAVENPPLMAGVYGFMTQTSGNPYAFISSRTAVTDFYTVVTFTNPDDVSAPFDYTFGFRGDQSGNLGFMLILGSDGTWQLQSGAGRTITQGTTTGFAQDPGATNTMELLVQGGTGVFAINGVVQTPLDVSKFMEPSTNYVITGYLAGDNIDGRRVSYQDWWLFPISE